MLSVSIKDLECGLVGDGIEFLLRLYDTIE